jgi:hypothetical protein
VLSSFTTSFKIKTFYILPIQCSYVFVWISEVHYFPTFKLTNLTTAFRFDEQAAARLRHKSETPTHRLIMLTSQKIYPLIRHSNYCSKMKTGRQGPDTTAAYTHAPCIDHWWDLPIVLRLLGMRCFKSASVCAASADSLLERRWSKIIAHYELND